MRILLSLHSLPSIILSILISLPSFSVAFTWHFNALPKQCSNLSLTIAGTHGVPPYNILVVPYGPSPLSSNAEVRSVIDLSFDGGSTFEFPINYPAGSQFVVVVSDATGFGSGGTSVAIRVMKSNNASCFNPAKEASTLFSYYVSPATFYQCQQTRIWWEKADVQGTPVFRAVIPGRQSFSIVSSNVTRIPNMGYGFSWIPPIRAGTLFLLVGGDDRGIATAGSTPHAVQYSKDRSCLDNTSPGSSPDLPVGWIHYTGIFKGANSRRTAIALLIVGIMGGVTPIAIAVLYYFARRRQRLRSRPRLLVNGIDGGVPSSSQCQTRDDLPEHHYLEPFPLSLPVMETQESGDVRESAVQLNRRRSRRFSQGSISVESSHSRFGYHGAGYQKHDAPSLEGSMVFVRHEDAGPSTPSVIHCEVIEPPPAYSRARRASQFIRMLV